MKTLSDIAVQMILADRLKVRYAVYPGVWDESQHPRGMPANAGEFRPKGSQPADKGEGFASPNESEGLSFPQARQNVSSDSMRAWVSSVQDIAKQCGLKAEVHPAIGDWATGAEQSAEIEFGKVADFDQLKYAMSIIGRQAHQFAVVPFIESDNGPDSIWEIEAADSMDNVRKVLDKRGIQFRTIMDAGEGKTRIIIYDPGSQLDSQTDGVAKEYGSQRIRKRGQGEFFPDGAESRAAAVSQYDQFIRQYEQEHPDRPHWQHADSRGNAAGQGDRVSAGQALATKMRRAEQTEKARYTLRRMLS